MSFLGLDIAQKGLSLYTVSYPSPEASSAPPRSRWRQVPAAVASIMAAHTYASIASGKLYDVANPRKLNDVVAADEKLNKIIKARIFRAEAAAANGFETLGLYAAGVVAANVAGVDPRFVNTISFSYIGLRILYNIVYIRLQDNRNWAPVRSLSWILSIACTFTLYFTAASKFASA
ncbi:hypothetical protein GCG54_00006043 [Colletotrichum gloeosporioides]|uniref:MAPEG family protein n=1 Tax=Colletotrichum gloeosporioides TaxID=474922 RepID=A0A8H4CM38_COLGL|nr:uncharacterized protein GCG54_00006043 [Colletotrichum gloeosporioides]KAF3806281.1 hypothetical protein GCG54_00006043 [Colletotrichum gloeosporioides]